MGGDGGEHGHHGVDGGDLRTKVWSMTRGPYCRPKHRKRNPAIAMFIIFLVCISIAIKSAKLEQLPHHPVRPIPSQLWYKNFDRKHYRVIWFAFGRGMLLIFMDLKMDGSRNGSYEMCASALLYFYAEIF